MNAVLDPLLNRLSAPSQHNPPPAVTFQGLADNFSLTFISENANSVEDPRVLWGAIKGFVKNTTILFASYLNRTKLGKINSLEKELQKLEQTQQGNGATEDSKEKIDAVRMKLNNILRL